MSPILIFAFLSLLGLVGAVFVIGKRAFSLRILDNENKEKQVRSAEPFFEFIVEEALVPFEEFVANVMRPAFLKMGEKFLRRFRILILKAENLLHRLSDYFRAKHIEIKNGNGRGNENGNGSQSKNSEFWNELHKTKEELKNGSQKTE